MTDLIQGLWIGKKLCPIEQMCLNSFLAQGSEFDLYTYDKIVNLPTSSKLNLKDGREILPEDSIFTYAKGFGKGSVSAFSNWFRYELLRKHGGFYVDLDVLCLKKFSFENEPYIMGWQDEELINPALLKIPKGDPLLVDLVAYCERPTKILPWDSTLTKMKKVKNKILHPFNRGKQQHWGHTGPRALTAFSKSMGLDHYAKPPDYFFPIDYRRIDSLLVPDKNVEGHFTDNTSAIHLFREVLNTRLGGQFIFPKGSFLDKYSRVFEARQ